MPVGRWEDARVALTVGLSPMMVVMTTCCLPLLPSKGRTGSRGWGTGARPRPLSEYHLPQQEDAGAHVTVRELLTGLSHLLKRLTATTEGGGALEPPLPRPQADRIQRTVAYQEVSESISRWIPIVKRSREAEHLSFSLQE